jgi:hypothetical protein
MSFNYIKTVIVFFEKTVKSFYDEFALASKQNPNLKIGCAEKFTSRIG